MNKFIPLIVGLMFPLAGTFAQQNSSAMSSANQTIIDTCRTEGGTFISFKDDKCDYSGCAYVGNDGGVSYDGDNERISGGCNIGDYRNKAKAAYKADIDKKIKDLQDLQNRADAIGKKDANGVTVGDLNGDGVVDDKDVAEANRRIAAGGTAGAQSGVASGAQSGVSSDDTIICEELEGDGKIAKGGLCYSECKPKRSFPIFGKKKEGLDRKSCVECLLKYPDIYHVKAEYLPKDKNGKVIGDASVSLGKGVTVKTGVIICRDKNGNVVKTIAEGGVCPSGSGVTSRSGSGVVVVGSTAGAGNGTVIVSGSTTASSGNGNVIVSGSASGSLQLPAACSSKKKKDRKTCEAWISANYRFLCASSANPGSCGENEITAKYMYDGCVNCAANSKRGNAGSTLSGIAEVVGALAGPAAMFGSALVGAKAYQKSNEAWANAATSGFEQCRLAQNDYLSYLSANELPGMTPDQQSNMNCNGYSLGAYAGVGGAYNGYYNAGYSPGYMYGVMGPYGSYNPYGVGGYVGGAVGGYVTGGYVSGYPTGYVTGGYVSGYPTGYTGGYVNGISIAGGIVSGYNGGYVAGGYVTGGYATGGYVAGYPTGYATGGYVSGYPTGYTGGYVNGISVAGGYVNGYSGGYYPGGYVNGTGYYPGGWASGANMGYNGYYNANNNYYNGGYYASQQAANIDSMLQQQGLNYQMGNMTAGYGNYGYNSAAYYPSNMNAGLYLNGSIGVW